MQPPISPILFSVLLFLGMLTMLEVGRRVSIRQDRAEPNANKDRLGTIEAAMLALFGLLIAFTFSGAASRFQEKRMLIAEEANAIESAYMRIDLVAPQVQAELRERFRQYVDSRLELYRRLPDMNAAGVEIARSKKLQGDIWSATVAATRLPKEDPTGARLLLPAITDMIRTTRIRMIALQNHPPAIVYGLLFLLGLLCSLLAGIRMASGQRRNWLHWVTFSLVTASVVYVTIDMEYPRIGLIRLEQADQVLMEVRAGMK